MGETRSVCELVVGRGGKKIGGRRVRMGRRERLGGRTVKMEWL